MSSVPKRAASVAPLVMGVLALVACGGPAGPDVATGPEPAAGPVTSVSVDARETVASAARGPAGDAASGLQFANYILPQGEFNAPKTFATAWPVATVEGRIGRNIAAMKGLNLAQRRAGELLVVRYSGDPRDYIDCGTILLAQADGAGVTTAPAAKGKLKLTRTSMHPAGRLDRSLRLDTRTVFRFNEPAPGITRVSQETTYVLTKDVNAFQIGGGEGGKDKWTGAKRQTIAFGPDATGSFDRGTSCRATGRLEQSLIKGLAGPKDQRTASLSPQGG